MKTNKTILLALAALFLASCGGQPAASSEPIVPASSENSTSSVEESLSLSEESEESASVSLAPEESSEEEKPSSLEESSESAFEVSSVSEDILSEESEESVIESQEPESEESNSPSEESLEESSCEPVSEEESLAPEESSEKEEFSSTEESIEPESEEPLTSEEVSSEEDGAFAWRMTRDNIPPTAQSKYNIDFSFEVSGEKEGQNVSFFGSYMQQGSGEWNGLIQMKKGEGEIGSYFYLVEGPVSSVEIAIHRRVVTYGGEAHDFTGIPTISQGTSFDSDDWSIIEPETEISDDENTIYYRFEVSKASFMVANYSFYALYIDYVANSI